MGLGWGAWVKTIKQPDGGSGSFRRQHLFGGSGGLQAGVISPGQSFFRQFVSRLDGFFKSEGEQQAC